MAARIGLFCCAILAAQLAWGQQVLFDQGHGQRFVIERQGALDLSQLANAFRDAGWVVSATPGALTEQQLRGVDVLLVSGAFSPYQPTELALVRDFVETGGTVVVLLHVGPLNGRLLAALGVQVSNGAVIDPSRRLNPNGSDFEVTPDLTHPLLQGVTGVRFYGAWALNPGSDAQGLLHASDSAWIDLNRNRQREAHEPHAPYAVAVTGRLGQGKFVVFGDDAIFQNRFLVGDNAVLAQNLVRWVEPQ